MTDHIELEYAGKLLRVDCATVGVSASGPAAPPSARWTITVDGVTRYGFPGRPADTEALVKAQVRAWARAHPELFGDAVPYQGYWIEPTPRQLQGTGEWTLEIQIARDLPGGRRVQLFNGANTFKTREAAVAGGVQFGRDILEGKVPPCAVLF